MPKPNRLIVAGDAFPMDPAYLAGARAARAGTATGRGTAAWRAGELNENRHEHVRFGLDVLALPPGDRDIPEDPDLPRLAPRNGYAALRPAPALLAQMETLRTIREAALACHANDSLPHGWRWADPGEIARLRSVGATYQLMRPGLLRDLLARRGLPVSPDMAKALLRRLEHEFQTTCEPLYPMEEACVVDAPSEVRRLLAAVGARQFADWLAVPSVADIEVDAGRPRGWCASVAAAMQRSGSDFLVHLDGTGGIRLSRKGCTGLALVERMAREDRASARAGFRP